MRAAQHMQLLKDKNAKLVRQNKKGLITTDKGEGIELLKRKRS